MRPAVLMVLMILASLAVMGTPTAASASELTTAACTGASSCTSETCTSSVTENGGEEKTCTSTSIYRVCRRSRGAKRPHCETVVHRYTETIIKEVVIKEVVTQPQP
ncbi:MAG TPA: hypothetical protein VN554_00325 [Verrucomicrobiae bacterium]|nr:hypothetical protein [Verrucomicrobiae bacterium]